MTYRARDVANHIVRYALQTGQSITNLQLQKVLYFLEAKQLLTTEHSLFSDDIEKWKLGPVIPDVYHTYKMFGYGSIGFVPDDSDFFDESNPFLQNNDIRQIDQQHINKIVDKLLLYTGYELVDKTHEHWLWSKDEHLILGGHKGIKYDKEEMKQYFKSYPKELNIVA